LQLDNNRRFNVLCRYVDSSNYWMMSSRPASGVLSWRMRKVVAGTATDVGVAGPTAAAGDVLEAMFSGSTLSWTVNGVAVGTAITDSDVATGAFIEQSGQFNLDPVSYLDHIEFYLS
jgi:hypothetical protein